MRTCMGMQDACVCAGALLVEEAGGRVSDLEGLPLDFSRGAPPPTSTRPHALTREAAAMLAGLL